MAVPDGLARVSCESSKVVVAEIVVADGGNGTGDIAGGVEGV